ncbi:MAG TPA: GNAT family N-acetyltransferase, partial [Candidatus Sericytochromatia bacterium]
MTEEIQVTIKAIDENSPHLQSVIALGDANKATLSFFPDGAFRRHAASSQIIVAIDSQSGCIGYLLYGASRRYNRITIIHLCISPSHKGRGVARKLVDYLIQLTQKYSGIGLTCRRDYQLGNFWAKLGFIAQYDEPAKTQKKINTYWWLDHGHPNLFSTAATYRRDSKLCVIIDANIFFNLSSNENNIAIDESKILLTDWLQGELDLCLTDEIFNKINHIHDPYNRKLQYNFAKRFTCLPCKNQIMDETLRHLQNFFIQNNISLDESELRYLAKTIAVDSYIFVTHDSRLLNVSDDIYESFRLSVIRPKELINQLEDLQGKPEYQPVRLGGTSLNYTCVRNIQNATLNKYFQGETKSVNKAQFQQKIRRFITETDKFECWMVLEGEKQLLALIVYDRSKKQELEIPLLWVGDNPLAATIAHHLLFQSASLSAREQRQFTRITDPCLQEIVTTAIQKDTFVKVKNGWLRANIAVAETALNLSNMLTSLSDNLGQEYGFCHKIANNLVRNE